MKRTITRLFDTRSDAEAAVRDLEAAGFDSGDISIIAPHGTTATGEARSFADDDGRATEAAEGAGKGAVTGGVLGGVAGLAAGLGLIAIPGIGPVLAAGWLATTAVGAAAGAAAGGATGGLLGALKEGGATDEEANAYAEGVRRGGTLVSVRAHNDEIGRAEQVLSSAAARDATSLAAGYRSQGWTRFDETAGEYRPPLA